MNENTVTSSELVRRRNEIQVHILLDEVFIYTFIYECFQAIGSRRQVGNLLRDPGVTFAADDMWPELTYT